MSEINSPESNSEVSESKETTETKEEKNLTDELDNNYESYIKEGSKAEGKKETDEVGETAEKKGDVSEEDDLDDELNENYNNYLKEGEGTGDAKDKAEDTEHLKCRNEDLAGKKHPETGVPFENKEVEVDGKKYEVTVPQFESKYDAQLPEDKLKATDREQFKECNSQLQKECSSNPDVRKQFTKEQLEQIEDGETPDGCTWHHDAETGRMQLVDTKTHQKTGHTGGRNIWGGGTENR
jgi:hypothetical protein